ncbi:hypothetical protein [Micromonospora kangleipakensis]|uniref:hypothetical protein n=1 Tax=Micromonospora kangleipakensis TaxID=1077942 RepID=UPI001A925F36|nr:hypothetical protein [Micromonospora kangleipakensis]
MKPIGVKPSRSDRCPSWKIQTTTPNEAPMESRFISTGLTGSNTEPKARKSSSRVAPALSSAIQGSRSPRLSSRSRSVRTTSWATSPVGSPG